MKISFVLTFHFVILTFKTICGQTTPDLHIADSLFTGRNGAAAKMK